MPSASLHLSFPSALIVFQRLRCITSNVRDKPLPMRAHERGFLRDGPNFLVVVVHRVVSAKLATRKSDGFVLSGKRSHGSLRARITRPALVIRWTLNGAGSGSPVGFLAAMCFQGKTGSGIRDTVSFSNRAQAWVSGSHPIGSSSSIASSSSKYQPAR
jgi:hypothetical protein